MRRRSVRAGLVGYSCATGVGTLTRAFWAHLPFTRWLIVPHPQLGVDAPPRADLAVSERRAGSPVALAEPGASAEGWLSGLDCIFSIEREFVPGLWAAAHRRGVRIVLMPSAEWFDPEATGTALIDRLIAPTRDCWGMLQRAGFGARTAHVPCPIETRRFRFAQRKTALGFAHFRGWGGHDERKGTDLVIATARRCPDVPFVIRCQRRLAIESPPNVRWLETTDQPEDQYDVGDVAVQPSRWEGVGLQILEAMACGLPTIVPDAPPMNEYPTDVRLCVPVQGRAVTLGQRWTAWEADVEALVAAIRALHGTRIDALSVAARRRVEQRSWERVRPDLWRAITGDGRGGVRKKNRPAADEATAAVISAPIRQAIGAIAI